MKKIILTTAIAAMVAPMCAMADTTVYGGLRMSAIAAGEKGGVDTGGVVNNASRLGVKGEYGDGGLTGFFNVQTGVRTDTNGGNGFTNRFAFAGVKGGFGKVVAGRLSTPYKMAGLKIDPFYDTSAGAGNGGSNYGLSSLTNGWLNNALGYVSPKLGGAFTVNALAILDSEDTVESSGNAGNPGGDNLFNIGATYSSNGITASIQHITGYDSAAQDDPTRLTLGYKTGAFSAGISYEDNAGAIKGAESTYVAGTYKMAPKTTLAASFGTIDGTGTGGGFNTQGEGFSLGLFQKIAPKTTVTAIYSDVDADTDANDRDLFAVGLIQNF